MIGSEHIKSFFEFLLEKYAETFLKKFEAVLFEIAKSEKFVKLFSVIGFSFFSVTLIFLVIKIVEINENVRINEERARVSSQAIVSVFNRANDFISFLENPSEKSPADKESYLNKIQEQAKKLNISGLAVLENGVLTVRYGALDPSYTDTDWNNKRLKEIEFNLSKMASSIPETYLVSFERRFRTRNEVLIGTNYLGSLVLARVWRINDKLNGYIVFLPMSEIAKNLRLSDENYRKGDYDYIIDQEGNLLCHPTAFIVYGTDENGNKLKNASEESEVGHLPVNTRDADWIAGTEILNKAFEKMLRGKSTNVVYKNLQYQPRLNNFNLISLRENHVSGNSLGIVAGRGLSIFESFIAPILLESPQSLSSVLYVTLSLYMVFILIWLYVLNRIRRLHQDIVSYVQNMSPETAKRLKLIPIKNNVIKKISLTDYVLILVRIEDEVYPRETIPTSQITRYLTAYLKKREWIIDRLGVREFIAFKEFKEKSSDTGIMPSAILSTIHSKKIISDLQQLVNNKINRMSFNLYYTIGDIVIESVKENEDSDTIVDITSKSITDLLELQNKIKNQRKKKSFNEIQILYSEELAKEKSLEIMGTKKVINNVPFLVLKTSLN